MEKKMKNASLTLLAALAAFLLAPHLAQAHHGWAEFELNREITLEGAVTDFHFTNPHCVVEFDVKNGKGQAEKWQGEFSSPGALARKGWTAASLQTGDKITITGNPAKNNVPAMHITRVRLANGQEFQIEGGR
jgi:hypothetical protein